MKISNDYTKQPMLKREQFLYICNYFNEAKKIKRKKIIKFTESIEVKQGINTVENLLFKK